MLHDPVENFVRRAIGLMRTFDEIDQDRLATRPGGPAGAATDLPLPLRAPVSAPPIELIEATGQHSARVLPLPPAEQPAMLPLEGIAHHHVPATLRMPAVPHPAAAVDLPDVSWPAPAAQHLVQIVQVPGFFRIAHYEMMDQRAVSIDQANLLDDRDVIGDGARADQAASLDTLYRLAGLAADTLGAVGHGTLPATLGTAQPVEAAALAGSDGAVAGAGNMMSNVAAAVQTGGEIGLFAVLGDAHLTTSLLQMNLLAGASEGTGNSLARVDLPDVPFAPVAAADSVALSLSVVDGDFYDILRITQTQVIDDRDVIAWDQSSEHLSIVAGDNIAGNAASYALTDWGAEIVIVTGDYVALREIVQVNLADDTDRVSAAGADPAAPVASPGTAMLNSAVLAMPAANEALGAMPDDVAALVATLVAGETPSPDVLSQWDLDGDGTVEALLVRGDFIDVKSVRQVNILADSDMVIATPAATPPDSAAPVIGGAANILSNTAVIADVTAGAQESFLAGQRYDASFLLDANLIGDPTQSPATLQSDIATDPGAGVSSSPAALVDAILFDAPTWGH